MPKRKFKSVEEFDLTVSEAKELIPIAIGIDGVENLTERPKNNEKQKAKYSGKKHTHTDIAMVLSDKRTKIYYISKLYDGHNVDFGIFKKEFPPEIDWFKNSKILVVPIAIGIGFVGIAKLYNIKELLIGHKKPRKSKGNPNPALTKEQKEVNKNISKERIFVEHAIGKTKRFRILKNRCRLKCQEMKNRILGICAALWNYNLELTI